MLTQRLTVESAPLPSPRRVTTAGKGREGKRCELDGQRGLQRLRPRVLLAASFHLFMGLSSSEDCMIVAGVVLA